MRFCAVVRVSEEEIGAEKSSMCARKTNEDWSMGEKTGFARMNCPRNKGEKEADAKENKRVAQSPFFSETEKTGKKGEHQKKGFFQKTEERCPNRSTVRAVVGMEVGWDWIRGGGTSLRSTLSPALVGRDFARGDGLEGLLVDAGAQAEVHDGAVRAQHREEQFAPRRDALQRLEVARPQVRTRAHRHHAHGRTLLLKHTRTVPREVVIGNVHVWREE